MSKFVELAFMGYMSSNGIDKKDVIMPDLDNSALMLKQIQSGGEIRHFFDGNKFKLFIY